MAREMTVNQIWDKWSSGENYVSKGRAIHMMEEFANDIIMTDEEMNSLLNAHKGIDPRGDIRIGMEAYRDWQRQKMKI